MNTPVKPPLRSCCLGLSLALALVVAGVTAAGCGKKDDRRTAKMPPSRYPDLGPKKGMPEYLKGIIYERVELENVTPYPVSAYGLIGRLRGTGDSFAPTPVRSWMIKEMVKRGFGSRLIPGYENTQPEDVLNSPNFAIVEVHAALPPGARQGDWIDTYVRCLSKNRTTSLSRGVLFETDLKENGANPQAPSAGVRVFVKAKGPVVTNPAYALENNRNPTGAARESLRRGTIMFNGRVMEDRPLRLQLRTPQRSMVRVIERRIDEHFQDQTVAAAHDEAILELIVPRSYKGDWQHFAGVATHLYLNSSPAFAAAKAKELAAEAQKPGAPLSEISYTWEGLGASALPYVLPMMTNADPNVAFAAARAAAFIGDPSGAATAALTRMAATRDHPSQLAAIQVLGGMPPSMSLNQLLRDLLNTDQSLVRIEAYKVLAQNRDSKVFSRVVTGRDGAEKFVLDIVPSDGPPLVYANRRGAPRIAIIGRTPALQLPVTFTALDMRLSITSQPNQQNVTMFYREEGAKPVVMLSRPDAAELVVRLGGEGATEEARLDFTYGEILAILQALTDQKQLAAPARRGQIARATFVLQEARGVEDQILTAPVIAGADPGRPAADSTGGRPTGGTPEPLAPPLPDGASGGSDVAPKITGLSPTGNAKSGRPQ
jgi:hypothetical protein